MLRHVGEPWLQPRLRRVASVHRGLLGRQNSALIFVGAKLALLLRNLRARFGGAVFFCRWNEGRGLCLDLAWATASQTTDRTSTKNSTACKSGSRTAWHVWCEK